MAAPTTTPLDRERPFGADELFFSTTDRRGVILAGNAVFQRVADYAEEELIGQAHNIVRHPDMPRGVFRVFWDHLDAKKPIAAYVKNMARDGAYYWVVATAVPMANTTMKANVRIDLFIDTFPPLNRDKIGTRVIGTVPP